MSISASHKTTPEIANDVLSDVTLLLKTEGELARSEVKQNIKQAVAGIASLVVAGAILLAGLTVLLFALGTGFIDWFGLAPVLAYALAGIIGLAIGGVLVTTAKAALSAENIAPTRTAKNLQKDVRVAKESLS